LGCPPPSQQQINEAPCTSNKGTAWRGAVQHVFGRVLHKQHAAVIPPFLQLVVLSMFFSEGLFLSYRGAQPPLGSCRRRTATADRIEGSEIICESSGKVREGIRNDLNSTLSELVDRSRSESLRLPERRSLRSLLFGEAATSLRPDCPLAQRHAAHPVRFLVILRPHENRQAPRAPHSPP
jgi:hypothetical protein